MRSELNVTEANDARPADPMRMTGSSTSQPMPGEDTGPGSARDLVVGGDGLGGLGAAQDFAGLGHALTTDPTGAGVELPAGASLPAAGEGTGRRRVCVDFRGG